MQNKKKSEEKAGAKSNPIIRTRAFVYDLYAKFNNTERIVLNELVKHHKCGNNILEAMRGKYFERIKVSAKDDRGYRWIGQAPDEKIIVSIHKEITEVRREYMKTYTSKPSPKTKTEQKAEPTKPTLEFLFDQNSDGTIDTIENIEPENKEVIMNKIMELFKKIIGK